MASKNGLAYGRTWSISLHTLGAKLLNSTNCKNLFVADVWINKAQYVCDHSRNLTSVKYQFRRISTSFVYANIKAFVIAVRILHSNEHGWFKHQSFSDDIRHFKKVNAKLLRLVHAHIKLSAGTQNMLSTR